MTNVFPLLSRSFHKVDGRAQRLQDVALKYLLLLGIPVAVGLATAAPRIVGAFYGDDFGNGTTLLRILSINVILYCFTAVFWRVLAARGEQGSVLRAQVATASLRLVLGPVLIAALRALGAAIMAPAALFLQALLLGRRLRLDGTRIRLVELSWRFAAAATVMGVVVVALVDALALWLLVPLAATVYFALLFALQPFSASELATFRTLLPSLRPTRTG